jgi:hypothetical protein
MSPRLSDDTIALVNKPNLVGALEWVARGFPVFRLVPGDKVPYAGSRGLTDATLDEATVQRWWTAEPDANVGVRLDGHLAVDFDTDHPGWRDSLRLLGPLPPTLTQLTGEHQGRRGFHLIYKAPAGVRFNPHPWPGVDIKVGTSGYIVGAPSRHPSGVNYELVWNPPLAEPPIAEAPAWLVEQARKRDRPKDGTTLSSPPASSRLTRGLRAGERDQESYKAACAYRGMGLDQDEALILMEERWSRTEQPPGDEFPWEKAEAQVRRAYAEHESEDAKELERRKRHLRLEREARRQVEAEEVGSDPDAEWAPTDLAEAFRHPTDPPQPFGLLGALYRGKVHWLQGEPESGKSVLAYAEAAHLIARGETVVVFDEEAGEADVADKLRALGAQPQAVQQRLLYFGPEGRDLLRHAGRLRQMVAERRPALVVLDSAGVFLALSGLDENKNPDVTRFIVRVLLPLAHDLGAGVVVLDHLTKKDTDDNDSRYARGAGDKLSRVDVSYRVWAQQPFSRTSTGVVMLRCAKDRTGVIGRGNTCRVAVVTGNGRIELLPSWLSRDEERQLRLEMTGGNPEDRVLQALTEAGGPLTTTALAEAIGRDRTTTSRLLNQMLREDRLLVEQSGRGSEKQWRLPPGPREM